MDALVQFVPLAPEHRIIESLLVLEEEPGDEWRPCYQKEHAKSQGNEHILGLACAEYG